MTDANTRALRLTNYNQFKKRKPADKKTVGFNSIARARASILEILAPVIRRATSQPHMRN